MKYSPAILAIMLITATIQVQADYWKDDSWYTSCYQALLGPSIEQIVPNLMGQRDQDILTHPSDQAEQLCNYTHFLYEDQTLCIDTVTCKITSGATYHAFYAILQSMPQLQANKLELRYECNSMLKGPMTVGSFILLDTQYYNRPDAVKLFILHHELQHHLYDDIKNNHLIKMIKLAQTKELKILLANNAVELLKHIQRYAEYRSDMQAMHGINCPYCLKEIAAILQPGNPGEYRHDGYLYAWQFQAQIDLLIAEKKCCQHHKNTGKQIDISIIDESSMLDRLVITSTQSAELDGY
ncbi:hypothetical protein KBC04_03680 [Candidatus Babeliales bacterium]|nr:hypothetical protein [Candidatus Babeliales bacterium]MBP9843847.1 hypothetical protein [Candidatus Babeliales bacterium]